MDAFGTIPPMTPDALTPLRFEPIFKPALWGGARLRPLFGKATTDEPIGEAWVLSDVPGSESVVADGPHAGTPLRQLVSQFPSQLLGLESATRFPLLLKFIHARQPLSIQVHPTDELARQFEGPAAVGKTEAWIVMEADPGARVYVGLEPGTTADKMRRALTRGDVEHLLYAHEPMPGDCFFLEAGTVHAIGAGLLLFEVQQPSDLTYRLYDWNRTDPKTGKKRELHVDKALASIDWNIGPCRPIHPTDEGHGRIRLVPLVECDQFTLGVWDTALPFWAGQPGKCRVLVGTGGRATLRHAGVEYPIERGSVWLLPAEVGDCECIPQGAVTIAECGF